MNSINVIMPVTVKAKLTEKLRARLIDEATKVAEQMELELKQINIDMQRELERNPQHEAQIRNFFSREMAPRQGRLDEAHHRKETFEKLALGAEIIQGTTERQVELKVGDNLREAMNVEILVEDDKIIAIRS
ncbi:MAG: YlqD family protein [Selenomonadaceae bacterium]|nr:YlqD family protein [Selenomonadaceae bacterium]MBQ3726602.1 YlqD family protein [Selenomonadaceae bacterium]MBQ9496577.1 YlqD family protein [Selenomonadaceae bacterium]MBR3498666.1 YlqD family protein [Selenomonadaceae bacterium]